MKLVSFASTHQGFRQETQAAAVPLILVPVEEVLDLLDADEVHHGLGQALVEEVSDAPVGLRASRNVHQTVVLLRERTPYWRIPGTELRQGVHTEVGCWRIPDSLGGVSLDSRPGFGG